ncbi:MAG: hypothetical protein AAB896_00795 [Patescibacteria group bacterium]
MSRAINFHYKKVDGFLRPIIPIEVQKKNRSVRIEVLVDSGADQCIFWGEIGEALGIEVDKGIPMQFGGVSGSLAKGYIHKVGIVVDGTTLNADVVFSYEIAPVGLAIVGQLSFFEHFTVKFDYKKRSVVLR